MKGGHTCHTTFRRQGRLSRGNIVVGRLGETVFASVSGVFDRVAVEEPGEVALL